MTSPTPLYGVGDPIAWHKTAQHGAGTGIVIEVRVVDQTVSYLVHQLIDAKATNRTLEISEDVAYPTRSLRDTRPQPAVHRTPPQ